MTPRLPGVLAAAMLLTPVVVLLGCAGFGYQPPAPELTPEQRTAEAVVWCKRAGVPVVRLEVEGPRTLIRCGSAEFTVMTKGARP